MLAGLSSRRRLVWAGIAALLLTLLGLEFAVPAQAQGAGTQDAAAGEVDVSAADADSAIGEGDTAIPADRPLIIVGVGGLIWPNITPENTPTLWKLLEDPATSAGAVTVHTVGHPACPAGGWLALSSGRPTPSPRLGTLCVEPYRTRPAADGGNVVDWPQIRDSLAATSFEPRLGTLAATLEEGSIEAAAIGPGAALALANEEGWVADFSRAITPTSFEKQLTIVDAGSTFAEDLSGRSMRVVDARVRRVLTNAPDDATILVTSVSAPEGARVQLGVTMLHRPGVETGHYLTSTATRWDGVMRLLDIPPTLAEFADVPKPADFGGAPLRFGTARPGAAETAETLADISVKDLTLRGMSGPVSGVLEISTFLIALFLIWQPWDSRHTSMSTSKKRVAASGRGWVQKIYGALRAVKEFVRRKFGAFIASFVSVVRRLRTNGRFMSLLRGIGISATLFFAVFPVSLYVMGAIPWWDLGDPKLAARVTLIVCTAILAAIVAVIPWRSPWQAIGVISLVSAAVMGIDVVLGSGLHRGSPMGPSPIYGGRFYGFGNTTYSFFVVHTLILAAVAGAPAARAGGAWRKLLSYLIVGGIGAVAVIIDVAPTWGADIGGGLALIPAFAFLAMVLNRARITITRVLVIGIGTAVAILGFAYLDWLRPAARRSHAGQFFEQLITGDAWQVIWRKAGYALNTLDTGLASRLTLILLALTVLALLWPERFAPAPLRDALSTYWALRLTLGSVVIGLVVGAALNDYGLRIVSLGFATAAPLLALLTVRGALPRSRAARTTSAAGAQ